MALHAMVDGSTLCIYIVYTIVFERERVLAMVSKLYTDIMSHKIFVLARIWSAILQLGMSELQACERDISSYSTDLCF